MNEFRYRTLSIICATLGVVATLVVAGWAIYHQEIREIWNKPKLEFSFFEPINPHLVKQTGIHCKGLNKDGKPVWEAFKGLFITIVLKNTGNRVGRNAQAVLTKIYDKNKDGNWKEKKGWIDIPFRWVVYPFSEVLNLSPERNYLFSLGSFSDKRDGKFLFNYFRSPVGQSETVAPGECCFEVTAFAVGADIYKKYFYITFDDFRGIACLDKIKNYVKKVEMKDHPPL